MNNSLWPIVPLGEVIEQRKEFITIDDLVTYKRCRVQLHAQGIVLRDELEGALIKTKNQQVCHTDEFLVAEIDAKVGGFGIVPPELEGAIVSSHYFLFVIDQAKLDKHFLGYFIRTPDFQGQVNARGSTNYAAVRPQHVLAYEIPLPPLAEQRRIVARIEALASKVEAARRLREETIDEAYSLELSISSKLILQNVPVRNLEDLIAPGSVISYGVLVPGADVPEGIPFVRVQDLSVKNPSTKPNKSISREIEERYVRTRLEGGEVLIGVVGSIGKVGIAPYSWRGANIARAVARIVPDHSIINPLYLADVLQSPICQQYFEDVTRTLAQPTLNVGQLRKTKIPVPSLPEQHRIVAYLDALKTRIAAIQQHQAATQARLEALMPSILDRAFKGEL